MSGLAAYFGITLVQLKVVILIIILALVVAIFLYVFVTHLATVDEPLTEQEAEQLQSLIDEQNGC